MKSMTRLPVVATLIGLLLSNATLVAQQDPQVTVEVRIITVSDNFFERIGVDFDFDVPGPGSSDDTANPPSTPGSFFTPVGGLGTGELSASQLQTVIRKIEKEEGTSLVSTPRIVANNGQSVRIDPPPPVPDVFSPPPNLQIIPTITPDGAIDLNINAGSYFRPFETTFDLFSGAALGNMSSTEMRTHTHQETIVTEREQTVRRVVGYQPTFNGMTWVDVPIYQTHQVRTQQEEMVTQVETEEFMRGAFHDQATLYGMRCACFCGLYFGMGGLVQYLDGDLRGAWMGELQGIARYPIEFSNWAFAPYVVAGVGAFLSADDYATFSLGGGIEVRPTPNVGFFTEARQTWTDDSDMNFTNVIGGIRIVTDGRGPRRVNTNVSVKEGGTVVLGGLLNNSVGTKTDRLPILGNLPYLGRLFKSSGAGGKKEDLLIFVTPRILTPAGGD